MKKQVKCSVPGCLQTAWCPKKVMREGKPVFGVPNGWYAVVQKPLLDNTDIDGDPIQATSNVHWYCPQHGSHATRDAEN